VVRRRQCQDASWEELLRLVDESIPPESEPLVNDILDQIEDYHRRSDESPGGESRENVHGFVEWLWGLQEGWAELPEAIPHAVLLAWRNGSANHTAGGTPIPMWRCEDCRMVLPNCTADGFGPCITPCPVCGGERIGHMNLWAWGTFSFP
jgi:hypothetical protein